MGPVAFESALLGDGVIADRCAFDHCQAGGVILPGAPPVELDGAFWHPGCWAAYRWAADRWRAEQAWRDAPEDPPATPEDTATPKAVENVTRYVTRACACVDRYGLPCQGVAGPDGWCSSCRSHANPAPVEVFT